MKAALSKKDSGRDPMKRNSLVCIIMPVFNPNNKSLQERIHSILSQTYDEIELIIVFNQFNSAKDEIDLAPFEEFPDYYRLKFLINWKRIGFPRL